MRKNKKKNNSNNKLYPILLVIATLFMGIGYAMVNSVTLEVEGSSFALLQDGVFITEVNYKSNVEADTTGSTINYALGTMVDSHIVLGSVDNSTITYQIVVYNNTDKEQMFIGVLTDNADDELYSNANIEYSLSGLLEYTTTIAPKSSIDFTITFKYATGADLTQNTLDSKLNFRFKEVPRLFLNNEGETYTLSDIYPDYTPQEYIFTVSNYNETVTNSVPMTYYFETTIDSPLTAKIYDESGNEVTEGITIESNGEEVEHTYTLKIIWDNSNPEDDIDYNNADEYADREFQCYVVLKAIPTEEKYMDYVIERGFEVNITTAPFYFDVDALQDIKVEKTASNLAVTIDNNNSNSEYNIFNTDYELSITGNDKFTVSIDEETSSNNVFVRILSGGQVIEDSFNIKFAADINNLSLSENATLNIIIKSPYTKEIILPLTLSLQPVTVTLNANGGTTSTSTLTVYKGKTYTGLPTPTWTGHTFNGWYTAKTGGTKITSSTEVTTSSATQTLYAQWTSRLLVDYVSVGDYVNYEIYYDNVGTNTAGGYIAEDDYTGWRVLSIEGSGDNRYVRLITAGVPMTYRHPYNTSSSTVGKTSVTNLTTGFFSTTMNTTTVTNNQFHRCGFKTSESATTYITSTSSLSTLFKGNSYTQLSGTTPMVQSVTKEDLDNYIADLKNVESYETENAEYLTKTIPDDDLFIIPSTTSGSYAAYFLATVAETYYVWQVRFNAAVVYTYYEYGVRPVVSLKTTVETTGQVGDVWQLN